MGLGHCSRDLNCFSIFLDFRFAFLWLKQHVETGLKADWLLAGDTKPLTWKGPPLLWNTKYQWRCQPADDDYVCSSTEKQLPNQEFPKCGFLGQMQWWKCPKQTEQMTQRWRHPTRGKPAEGSAQPYWQVSVSSIWRGASTDGKRGEVQAFWEVSGLCFGTRSSTP